MQEISFHEGDLIVEIEAISEDWWQGEKAKGLVGLFSGTFQPIPTQTPPTKAPSGTANYVEVQQ